MSQHGTTCAGHEGAGVIVKVGDQVKNLKVGQRAGFKPVADTCGQCDLCRTDKECYCAKAVLTGYHCDGMRTWNALPFLYASTDEPWMVTDRSCRQLQAVCQESRAVYNTHPGRCLRLRSWANHVFGIDHLHVVEDSEPETRAMGRLPRWRWWGWYPRCPTSGSYGLASHRRRHR